MKLPAITLTKESLMRFGEVITQEWIVTNGLGSYASSTVPGINTRKYHGLLVAALNPPGDRTVCLAKLDEDIILANSTHRLGSNEFENTIFPEGYRLIKQFSLEPLPTYLFDSGNVTVKKRIFLPQLKNAAAIVYNVSNRNALDIKIRLYPLLTSRYYHTVIDRLRIPLSFTQETNSKSFKISFIRPLVSIVCRITEGRFVEGLNWVERLHYREEASRGEADFDDCFQPGYFELQVPAETEKEFAVTCAVNYEASDAKQTLDSVGATIGEVNEAFTKEIDQRTNLLTQFYINHPKVPISDWLNWMLLAADSFLVQSSQGRKAVIAGYFWFEPWGRDTFISLPGLTLVTSRFSDAKDILQNFMRYFKGGMIPNFIADKTGVPIYNTVDGTLWYVNAVLQYLKYTSDFAFVKDNLWANMQVIIENHQHGTMFNIRLDDDGLLAHGPRLTWMDAVAEGDAITPRAGKAVEIQALWYNTLKIMQLLASRFDDTNLSKQYATMAEQTCRSFNEKFWNPKLGCLYDVLEPTGPDSSLRPNQIFAVSLDYSMLSKETSRRVVDVVNRKLVTAFGLRTLSSDDPRFVGKCLGDRRSRDTAYHNGTIWTWLLGPYVSAYLKVNDYAADTRKQALENLISPLFKEGIRQGGLGTISEIYDSDPPNTPRGCISQSWSVAEPLRAYVEDILQVKPKQQL